MFFFFKFKTLNIKIHLEKISCISNGKTLAADLLVCSGLIGRLVTSFTDISETIHHPTVTMEYYYIGYSENMYEDNQTYITNAT